MGILNIIIFVLFYSDTGLLTEGDVLFARNHEVHDLVRWNWEHRCNMYNAIDLSEKMLAELSAFIVRAKSDIINFQYSVSRTARLRALIESQAITLAEVTQMHEDEMAEYNLLTAEFNDFKDELWLMEARKFDLQAAYAIRFGLIDWIANLVRRN